jgi:hypothetical protein
MSNALTPIQIQIIGTALMEILDGKLTDETIKQINTLKRNEICHPTEHIVGFIQGTVEIEQNREWLVHSLLSDIAFLAKEKLDELNEEKMP